MAQGYRRHTEQGPVIKVPANEVRDAGFRHVVLLGMGGSSLGPEVLRQTFGSAPGYPELIVLDSTVPAWVESVAEAVDPARTILLVSSKSVSTTGPNMFYAHSGTWRRRQSERMGLENISSPSPTPARRWREWPGNKDSSGSS